jgi:hypothetical protein
MSLVDSQLQIVSEFEGLYDPIVGATDGHGREAVPTPRQQLEQTFKLKEAYTDLRTELIEEIGSIEVRVIKPAVDARDCIAPIRKTIKKRENKRVDYEKLQEKVIKLQRKQGRTAKEDAALAKTEDDMARAAEARMPMPLFQDQEPVLTTATGVRHCGRACSGDLAGNHHCVVRFGTAPFICPCSDPKPTFGALLHHVAWLLRGLSFPIAAASNGRSRFDLEFCISSNSK